MGSPVFDATTKTVRTHSKQRISTRNRKNTVRMSLVSMHKIARKITQAKNTWNKVKTQHLFHKFAMLSCLNNGEQNDTHPLAFVAGCMGGNPNILTHRDAMRASDVPQFEESMDSEMENLFTNEIYELIQRNEVPPSKTVLRSIWSHQRKTKPDGTVYRHRSRICVDGSMQKEGIDFTDTYSPVVTWSMIRTLFTLGKTLG